MKSISLFVDIQRDRETVEIEVTGTYIEGFIGTYFEPPESLEIEDLQAVRLDNSQIIELTVEEEEIFANLLIEKQQDSYINEEYD